MTKNTVLCTLFSLLPLACVENDDPTLASEALDQAPEPPDGTEAIRASEDVTRATGVVRYLVSTDDHVQRIVAFDADGNVVGESAAERRADGGMALTYMTEDDVIMIEHDEPTLDGDGNNVYRLAIDGQVVTLRETPDGPVIEGELQLADSDVLDHWRLWDQDLVDHIAQWRTWSCTSCNIQLASCTAGSVACTAACLNPATAWYACVGCAAGVTTCWNGYYNNCGGVSCGGGGGSGGGGYHCLNSFDCGAWEMCLGGYCS